MAAPHSLQASKTRDADAAAAHGVAFGLAGTNYIAAAFVKWVEAAGGRPVPIRYGGRRGECCVPAGGRDAI